MSINKEVKVILYGLGEIGKSIAKALINKQGIKIIGAVDINPNLLGRDLGELLGMEKTGVKVNDRINQDADIAIHATVSYLPKAIDQIEACISAGMDVISTCEELSFPYIKYPELAKRIDEFAKKEGVTVLGSGINPGFLMDSLPIFYTVLSQEIKSIKVTRMMNSSKRRIAFQRKIGTGLSVEEFMEKVERKEISGHVGLFESIGLISSALELNLDKIIELKPEPVIAKKKTITEFKEVLPGKVAGLISKAYGYLKGKPFIELEFIAHCEVEEEYDELIIEGIPRVHSRIIGGIHGDIGTTSVISNLIPRVIESEPGLITMKDLIKIRAWKPRLI